MRKIKITNSKLYSDKVSDVDVSGLVKNSGSFHGTVSIETDIKKGAVHYTGEHGANDYKDEFGFIII